MINLPERAETISDDEILKQPSFNDSAVRSIMSYVNWRTEWGSWKRTEHRKYRFLAAIDTNFAKKYAEYRRKRDQDIIRGNTLRQLESELEEEADHIIDAMMSVTIDYPLYLLSRKGLGKSFIFKRIKALLATMEISALMLKFADGSFINVDDDNVFEIQEVKSYQTILLDDVHYWLEYAIDHRESLSSNLVIINRLASLPKEGQTVAMCSEFPLWYYEKAVNDASYSALVQKMEHSFEAGAIQNEIIAPSYYDMKHLCDHYYVKYDKDALRIISLIKPNHRALIRMVNYMGALTMDNLKAHATMLGHKISRGRKYNYLKMIESPVHMEFQSWKEVENANDFAARNYTRVDFHDSNYHYILTLPFEIAFGEMLNRGMESPILERIRREVAPKPKVRERS